MTPERESALERARKVAELMRRAGTEGEAQAAALAFQRILANHDLSMEEVDAFEGSFCEREKVVEEVAVDAQGQRQHWRGWLSQVVGENFRCDVFWGYGQVDGKWGYTLNFVGLQDDVTLARETYKATVGAMERLVRKFLDQRKKDGAYEDLEYMRDPSYWGWDPHCREYQAEVTSRALQARQSWIGGFINGLRKAFREQVQTMAIVLTKDALVVQHMKDLHLKAGGGTEATYSGDWGASAAGYEAGQAYGGKRKALG